MTKLIKRIFLGAVIIVLGGAVIFNAVQSSSNSNKSSSPKGLAINETGDEGVWQYNRMIKIDNNADSDLTDHQIKIELNSANFDFEKANINGNDIRFTEENKKTEIPNYWIESWDKAEKTATLWVKVPYIPASSTKKIYIHYGNLSATSVSNGNLTFEFFDDFETDKGWIFNTTHTAWVPEWLDGYGERTNEYYVSPETSYKLVWSKCRAGSTPGYIKIQTNKSFDSAGGERVIDLKHKLTSIYHCTDVTVFIDHTNEIWRGHNITDWIDVNTESFSLTPGSHTIHLRFLQNKMVGASNGVSYWDDIRVRKYIAPEPSVTVGKEKIVQGGSY